MPSDTQSFARSLAWAAVVFFFAVYGFVCVHHGRWDKPRPEGAAHEEKRKNGTDFTAYYSAGELARTGGDIYDYTASSTPRRPFIYPPMFAVFPMAPLSLLPHNVALGVFYVFNVALLLASLWMLRKLLWPDVVPLAETPMGAKEQQSAVSAVAPCSAPSQGASRTSGLLLGTQAPHSAAPGASLLCHPDVGLFLAVAICWRYLHSNFVLGNANLYILFLITTALYLIRRGRPFASGLAVALATVFKLTPGLFGLYLLWIWRRAALLGGALGLALFLLVAPALLIGFSKNWQALNAFAQHAAGKLLEEDEEVQPDQANPTIIGWRKSPDRNSSGSPRGEGVSFRGTLMKLLTSPQALKRQGADEGRSVNIVNLEPLMAKCIADGCSLLLLLFTVLLTAPRWAREGEWRLELSWSLVAITMLLIAPLTRKAHLVVLIIPVAVLLAMLQQNILSKWLRRLALCALLILGLGGPLSSPEVLGDYASGVIGAAGISTWSMVLLYVTVAALLIMLKPQKIV